jgi:hypothetical protein
LVKPFLSKERKTNPKLLERIATLYSQNKTLCRQFRHAAEVWADALTVGWGQLQKASKQFKDLRNQWITHNEVEWDSVNQTFRPPPSLATITQLYPALRKVVRIIDRAMVHLMVLVIERRPDEAEEIQASKREKRCRLWNLRRPLKGVDR